jgi:adenine-specific DNA-methyltransferase
MEVYNSDGITLHCGDCREVLATLPDASVDLIVTDPPYFKVKDDWWDRQWDKPEEFAAWMGTLCDQWQRVLKPNGSLYVFASPQMAWHVEGEVRKRFSVLNRITWAKPAFSTKAEMNPKEWQRLFFPRTEAIIFAEHFGADNAAKGEAGYGAKCDELRGFVFEPLRAYLANEWERAGLTTADANTATGTQMAGHWFTRIQWALPTAKHYATLQARANASGGDYLRREYDYLRREYEDLRREYEDLRREYEDLRREYEDLRREYEDLRRPFYASESRPYTDVWDFQTVGAYEGKHPCEKPLAMMEHIIQTSSRPGAVVLDCFAGSGVVGEAVRNIGEGRQAILCEIAEKWCNVIRERLRQRVLF